jgi:hypothetical protein
MDDNALKEGLNFFLCFEIEYRNAVLSREHNLWLKLCDQVLKSYSKHPHTSTKTASSTILNSCCFGECGSAALK